jgi:hypothetical protein
VGSNLFAIAFDDDILGRHQHIGLAEHGLGDLLLHLLSHHSIGAHLRVIKISLHLI